MQMGDLGANWIEKPIGKPTGSNGKKRGGMSILKPSVLLRIPKEASLKLGGMIRE